MPPFSPATPISPPSGPSQWLFQGPPAESKFLAVNPTARPLNKRVLLMGTCLCDAFYDDTAKATVEVLEHLGISVEYPENQPPFPRPPVRPNGSFRGLPQKANSLQLL